MGASVREEKFKLVQAVPKGEERQKETGSDLLLSSTPTFKGHIIRICLLYAVLFLLPPPPKKKGQVKNCRKLFKVREGPLNGRVFSSFCPRPSTSKSEEILYCAPCEPARASLPVWHCLLAGSHCSAGRLEHRSLVVKKSLREQLM